MPIRKRKFKTGTKWCVDVMLPNGERYRRVIGTRKQTEQVQKKLESEIVEGKWDIRLQEDVPFNALAMEYAEYAEASKSASTVRADECRIESHLIPYFGDTPLTQITAQMIDSYKAMRVQEGAAPKTVNNELSVIAHMMKMAVRWGYLKYNVAANVEKKKLVKNPPRFLSEEEIERLAEAARKYYIYPLIVTALHTGMRKSELFNLKWSDVDFEHSTITVQSKDDWHTKNYKSRVLALTPRLCSVLLEHHSGNGMSDYLFTWRGRKLKCTIKKSLRTLLRDAGLENVTLHTLRHTFASQLVMAGVSLREVQELMGHADYQTTLQYAHLSRDHVKSQVLRLPFAN